MQNKRLCVLVHIWAGGGVGPIGLVLDLQCNIFTDSSRAVLLLWLICGFVSCVSRAFASVRCCLVVACWGGGWPLVGDVYCSFVTFPCCILCKVWYLNLSFPDLSHLSFFH